MGGLEHNLRCHAGLEGLDPAQHVQAPPVSRLEAAEAQSRGREITDMMRQSDQMVARVAEEFEQRKSELAGKLVDETRAAIKVVAEAGKFDLVLQDAVYAKPAIDITPLVLKEMQKRSGK